MSGSSIRELGQALRDARERKGVTLAEAQQATKIRQAFLQALEQENYSILPPPVYIRGFLKTYSNYLGLDAQSTVQAFDELMEAVAMGVDPYQGSTDSGSADSGSADSGGANAYSNTIPYEQNQALAGLTEGEANLLEETAEIYRVTPEKEETETISETKEPTRTLARANQALVPVRRNPSVNALRVPERYVLRPAIPPLNKPSFYIPNFMPALAVLIIVAAALLLLYRGVVVPSTNDNVAATATPNVFSAPTVTPLSGTSSALNGPVTGALPGSKTPASINTVAPDPTVLAAIASGAGTQAQSTVAATTSAAPPPPTATPTPPPQPVKLELVVSSDSSWVQVWVDDKAVLNKLVKGETLDFEGTQKVEIALGKPSAVKILVNGQEKQYAPPGSGAVVKYFKSDGSEGISR